MQKAANKGAVEAVKDMHRGLHIALDHLITRGDAEKAEEVLRQLDHHMANWINNTQVIK